MIFYKFSSHFFPHGVNFIHRRKSKAHMAMPLNVIIIEIMAIIYYRFASHFLPFLVLSQMRNAIPQMAIAANVIIITIIALLFYDGITYSCEDCSRC